MMEQKNIVKIWKFKNSGKNLNFSRIREYVT